MTSGDARLVVTCPDAAFGDIAPGATARNDAEPFVLFASSLIPPGTWVACTLKLCAATPLPDSLHEFWVRVGVPASPVIATLDTGMVLLTVTGDGAQGFDEPGGRGRGFRVPKDYPTSLRYGAFAVTTGPDYTVDRFYRRSDSLVTDHDWVQIESLGRVLPPAHGNVHWRGRMSDVGHPAATGLTVEQNWYALAQYGYKDLWVIGTFDITSHADTALTDVYAGLFSDLQVTPFGDSNTIVIDESRRGALARCLQFDCPTAGVVLLDPPAAASIAAIDHAAWVNPDSCLTDAQKCAMLEGGIASPDSLYPADWSVVLSAGPFTLAPDEPRRVAFAWVGTTRPETWYWAADTCQAWYDRTFHPVAVEQPGSAAPGRAPLLAVTPTVVRAGTPVTVASSLDPATPATLTLHDPTGRVLCRRTLQSAVCDLHSAICNLPSLPSGIYFLRVDSPAGAATARFVITR